MIAIMANINSGSDHSVLWGRSIDFWDWLGIRALLWGAALGVIALLLTAASAYVLYRVADVAQKDLEAESKTSALQLAGLAAQAEQLRKDTAEANARAAAAQLELAKLKAPRTLSDEQIARIKEKVKFFEGQHFSVVTYWNLKEPTDLAKRIGDDALISSGWQYDNPPKGESFIGIVTGVEIQLSDASSDLAKQAARALSKALEAEGIDAPIRNEPTYTTLIKLSVGMKP